AKCRGAALIDIDNADATKVDLHLRCLLSDHSFWADENRRNQVIFERLVSSSERDFIARPNNCSFHWRLGICASNKTQIMTVLVVHDKLRHRKCGPAQLRGWSKKVGRSGEDRSAFSVVGVAVEDDLLRAFIFCNDFDVNENAVPDADAILEGQRHVGE